MKAIIKKMFSRKFLAAAAGIVTGLAMVFGLDEGVITTVAGAVTALGSAAVYIVSEGMIDAEAVRRAAEAVGEAKEVLTDGTDQKEAAESE